MKIRSPSRLSTYLAAVCCVGLPALVITVWSGLDQARVYETSIAVLVPLIVVGELIPIRVPRGDDYEELTVSTTFAFAVLLISGPAVALAAMAAASIVSDVVRRRPMSRGAFNVAQYSLSLLTAAAVLHGLGVGALGSGALRLTILVRSWLPAPPSSSSMMPCRESPTPWSTSFGAVRFWVSCATI